MSLYHLVKLEMLIAHVLPLRWYRKRLQNLSHGNCGLTIHQIWIQLITECGSMARQYVKNTHHWSGRTETATENGVEQAGSRRDCGSHPSAASSIAPDQWCMFYTPSCNIFNTLLSIEFKYGEFGDHSSGGINSGVSLSNNAIVARAVHVSQGSVETLFRRRGKRLNHVVANLILKTLPNFVRIALIL